MSTDPTARTGEYTARVARWRDRLAATTLTDVQADGLACVACGRDYLAKDWTGAAVPIGHGPHNGQVFVCRDCDTEPTLTAEAPPVDITTAAMLHEVERKLTAAGWHELAAEVRAAIARHGIETIPLDEIVAEATVLASHAPHVRVPARETGDRLLRVVGDL